MSGSTHRADAPAGGALTGKRVAVTRAADQSGTLAAELEGRGANVILCPTIRLAEPESWAPLDRAIATLGAYDWIVFTSPNGVRFALGRMAELGEDPASLGDRKVAAAGSVTAEALAGRGVPVAFVSADAGSMSLAETLEPVQGTAIALLRSDRADSVAARILEERGARNVDDIVAYRTVPVSPGGAELGELRAGLDGLTFTSPSTVLGFLEGGPEWRRCAESAIVATLGPATSAAARAEGLVVEEADEKTMVALVEALERGFAKKAAEARRGDTRESAG